MPHRLPAKPAPWPPLALDASPFPRRPLGPYSAPPRAPQLVGIRNLTEPDCSLIDFDSLLLGGCYCHVCLPENPCGGGTCVNYNTQGYTCDCSGTGRTGDHCEIDSSGVVVNWPWYRLPAPGTQYSSVVTLVAAGSVEDYTSSRLDSIRAAFATSAGVPASSVTATVRSASVVLEVKVIATDSDHANNIASTFSTQLSNATAATSFLAAAGVVGVSVVATPAVTQLQEQVAVPSGRSYWQRNRNWLIPLKVGAPSRSPRHAHRVTHTPSRSPVTLTPSRAPRSRLVPRPSSPSSVPSSTHDSVGRPRPTKSRRPRAAPAPPASLTRARRA